jgi:hypothetical protein
MDTGSIGFGSERLAHLVEALPVGVFILNGAGEAIYANAAAQSLLGRGVAPGDRANNLGQRFAAVRAGTNDPYPNEAMPIVRALAGERTSMTWKCSAVMTASPSKSPPPLSSTARGTSSSPWPSSRTSPPAGRPSGRWRR